MTAIYASLTIFFLVGAISLALYNALYGSHRGLEDRITEMAVTMRVSYGNASAIDIESPGFARSLFLWVTRKIPEPAYNTPEDLKLTQTLVQAGFASPEALRTFHFVRISAIVLLALAALLLSRLLGLDGVRSFMLMFVGAGAGVAIPNYYLSHRVKKRRQRIAAQLSDVLDLLVVCVEAGLGVGEAIKIVGAETQRQGQEIGVELSTVSAELGAGSTLAEAMKGFAARTGVDDIKPLASTLVQSEKLGAQIGPALHSLSDSIRNTRRTRAEEAAAKTTVKMLFPLVFFILPAMMAVILGPAMIQIMHTFSH
ncbi:MAG: type II secretion system F family protein [Candidatus Binatus sp.]|uniref:type II secretion system F family protein n=1 Tax=Candidatus Binatus sp. TaxID=2811406 RepID=UPI002728F1CC|nr:type II secretion system F family protein [Candidatus Binatus sp.]MDO8432402.1 type II secretion system F family protein [Candidatus Binatus sp.]